MSTDATTGYRIAGREDALDFMAGYPGYGEQRWYSDALGTEQVSFSWRRMPSGTGGRGSYGHRHPGHEEVYFVISGTVTFKVDQDVFEAGPQSAVRMTGREFYSVHNDTEGDAELLIVSARVGDMPLEKLDGFWPETPPSGV
jgi:mannose-6-phosphate isomerase-like protein (cupin superfamily)